MKLIQSIVYGRHRLLLREVGRRYLSTAQSEAYEKRNYAKNTAEYKTVISSVTAQRRHYLLRDVYDDMMLDGVQPTREVFHSLVLGSMKGARLQDAFYFTDEMKAMGLLPDVSFYNFLISACGKSRNSDHAVLLLEEMKRNEVKPTGQTYICLLNACAASGRLDQVYSIVRDMTAAGLGLNKFCYAGLIAAHKNKPSPTEDTAAKIIELVEQSKGWSSEEATRAEDVLTDVSEEDLYNLPTAEYVHRRAFLSKPLTVYHVACHAVADLRNVEAMKTLLDMLEKENKYPDVFITMQTMRCYLHSGDLDGGVRVFEDYMNSGKLPMIELYVTLAEGAMVGYTPEGMQVAHETLVKMNSRRFVLSPKMGSNLLLIAAGEKNGGYTTANYIWDLMKARKTTPSLAAVEAYYNGLKEYDIPSDDPRLLHVSRTLDSLRARFGAGPPRS